jgi:hypothetical protein
MAHLASACQNLMLALIPRKPAHAANQLLHLDLLLLHAAEQQPVDVPLQRLASLRSHRCMRARVACELCILNVPCLGSVQLPPCPVAHHDLHTRHLLSQLPALAHAPASHAFTRAAEPVTCMQLAAAERKQWQLGERWLRQPCSAQKNACMQRTEQRCVDMHACSAQSGGVPQACFPFALLCLPGAS